MTWKDRFEKFIMPEPNTGCWFWTGSIDSNGYGHFQLNGRPRQAHRLAFELYRSQIPHRMVICHHCDNPMCVNPDHLFCGTYADNTHDMIRKNRAVPTTGTMHGMCRLTEAEVIQIRINANNGSKQRDLASQFKVSFQHISDIVNYKRWKHL